MKSAELSEKAKLVKCSMCAKKLTMDKFYFDQSGRLDRRCKICQSTSRALLYQQAKNANKATKKTRKRCVTCGLVLGMSRFPLHVRTADGHAGVCWPCKLAQNKLSNNTDLFWWRRACNANKKGRDRLKGKDLKNLFEQQKEKCFYCGVSLGDHNINVDHKNPIAKGGTNKIDNIAIACKDCNFLKLARTADEFINFLRVYYIRLQSRFESEDPVAKKQRVKRRA